MDRPPYEKLIMAPEFLKQPSDPVTSGDPVKNYLEDILAALDYYKDDCLGLAAVQLGIKKRLFVLRDPDNGRTDIFINPVIKFQKDPITLREGCMSFPGRWFRTNRWGRIILEYQDEILRIKELEFEGLHAATVQHCLDLCNGILWWDHKVVNAKAEDLPGPNEPCQCGSGLKFKKCCQYQDPENEEKI